ncbi:MAG: hypothetical protein Q4A81_08235 [Pasteurellaceae bacterium]|nr:hypothetical protein [Pasteurellaceae bacterium]
MKKFSQILLILIAAMSSITVNAADLDKHDEGEYVVVNPQTGKETEMKFKFTKQSKIWIADFFEDGKWKPIACGASTDHCAFTTSSRKTVDRLFSAEPNLQKALNKNGVKAYCIDSTDNVGLCRVDDRKNQISFYFLHIQENENANLLVLKRIN